MFDHKHYVPILKTKAGERWAVDRLESGVADGLTPLFEVHEHDNRSVADHASNVCDDLESIWGADRPLFIDCCWLQPAAGDPSVLSAVFSCARNSGIHAIPVVRPTFDQAALDVVNDIVEEDGHGYMLRVPPSDAKAGATIDAVVNYLALPKNAIHMLIDYRSHPMDLANDIPGVYALNDWLTLTSASSAFPRSLANLPLHTWHDIPRHDWTSWEAGVLSGIPRRPSFSDYTTRDPGAPAGGGRPKVNLRYTNDSVWRVHVARSFQEGFSSDMRPICANLIASANYSGATFSEGDRIINEVAQGNVGTGAPQQWVQWGMNHHLTFAVRQLQAHPGL